VTLTHEQAEENSSGEREAPVAQLGRAAVARARLAGASVRMVVTVVSEVSVASTSETEVEV